MSYSKAFYWKNIVNNKIESIMNNHTWELIDFPSKSKSLGHKWIFFFKKKLMTLLTNLKLNESWWHYWQV